MEKKTRPMHLLSTRHLPQIKRHTQMESKVMKKIFHANISDEHRFKNPQQDMSKTNSTLQ